MSWHLVATGNTVTWVHIDSDGVCSKIRVVCGRKLWIMGQGRKKHTLADILVFLGKDFYLKVASNRLQ